MIKKISVLKLCALLFLGTASHASAAIVSYEYFGEIASFINEADLNGQFSAGDEMRATFSYDTEATDWVTIPDYGEYWAGTFSIEVTHGTDTFTYQSGLNPIVRVRNNNAVGLEVIDSFTVLSNGVTGPSVNNRPPTGLVFQLADYDASVFSDDTLPSAIPLNLFETDNINLNYIIINFNDGVNPTAQIRGQITGGGQISGNAVPLPGAVWLLGSGCVGLAALKRRRK